MLAQPQLLVSVTVLILSCRGIDGQISVPRRPLGFFYGESPQTTSVEVVAYLDPTCPDSKAVYPTLLQIGENYAPSEVRVGIHLFPLPYHRNSHVISKAAQVLHAHFPHNNTAFTWLSTVFHNLSQLTTGATANLKDSEVMSIITDLATQQTGIQEALFITKMADSNMERVTRQDFKYSCSRGVHSTPMFTVNDVFLEASHFTFEQWKSYLDEFL